jgi:hypothetical protein
MEVNRRVIRAVRMSARPFAIAASVVVLFMASTMLAAPDTVYVSVGVGLSAFMLLVTAYAIPRRVVVTRTCLCIHYALRSTSIPFNNVESVEVGGGRGWDRAIVIRTQSKKRFYLTKMSLAEPVDALAIELAAIVRNERREWPGGD